MNQSELEIRQKLKDDLIHYAVKCLKIRSKSGDIIPFEFNRAQLYVHKLLEKQRAETGKVRALVLKGRQQGMSTYIGARYYHQVTHRFGCQAFIMAHRKDATDNLYRMAQRYYEHTPDAVKPAVLKSNAKELIFGVLDSGYKLGTAETKETGRSATIQLLHASEVAFWNNSDLHAKGLLQAVPDMDDTEVVLESTANGVGNFFHQKWQEAESGLSDYIAIFVPWFWQPEYSKKVSKDFIPDQFEQELINAYGLTHGQLAWRRNKIVELSVNGADGAKSFQQEYPMCPAEAFILTGEDNFMPADIVIHARKTKNVEGIGPLIIGVDPARFGDDRSVIIKRQGRKSYDMQCFIKKDTMEITGYVHQIIKKDKPAAVNIDIGGLGAGVYDRLVELGHHEILNAVNFGSRPLDGEKYRNKKAEMWGEMKEWLQTEIVCIPDSDELQADLCNTKYKIDSMSRLEMESKDAMKKRGVRSSDCADALALTFAMPESALQTQVSNQQNNILQSLTDGYTQRYNAIGKSYTQR